MANDKCENPNCKDGTILGSARDHLSGAIVDTEKPCPDCQEKGDLAKAIALIRQNVLPYVENLYAEELRSAIQLIEQAAERIEELERMCGWIPVNESLPELAKDSMQSDWVLVTDGERWVEAYYYDYTKRGAKPNYATGKGWYCHGIKRNTTTHWMRIILPKQPKAALGKEEDNG
jgi:hypothetical protein